MNAVAPFLNPLDVDPLATVMADGGKDDPLDASAGCRADQIVAQYYFSIFRTWVNLWSSGICADRIWVRPWVCILPNALKNAITSA